MKRSPMPGRRDPLTPGQGPVRRAPMPRGVPDRPRAPRTPAPRRPPADTGPDDDTAAAVDARDGGMCQWPGCTRRATNRHHRQNRGSGGRKGAASAAVNSPANLVLACGSGTTGHHGLVTNPTAFGATRAEVVEVGWVIPTSSRVDPATVPILTRTDGWAVLTHGATIIRLTPGEQRGMMGP